MADHAAFVAKLAADMKARDEALMAKIREDIKARDEAISKGLREAFERAARPQGLPGLAPRVDPILADIGRAQRAGEALANLAELNAAAQATTRRAAAACDRRERITNSIAMKVPEGGNADEHRRRLAELYPVPPGFQRTREEWGMPGDMRTLTVTVTDTEIEETGAGSLRPFPTAR